MILTKQKPKQGGAYVAMLSFKTSTTATEIKSFIETYYNMLPGMLMERTQVHKTVIPRHIAIWLITSLKQEQNFDKKSRFSETARNDFPGFDHSSIHHSYHFVENRIATNQKFRKLIANIINKFKTRYETLSSPIGGDVRRTEGVINFKS